jgi:hypothetical protein
MTKDILFELNQSDPAETISASRSEIESAGALRMHIGRAISETKRLVHLGDVRRGA